MLKVELLLYKKCINYTLHAITHWLLQSLVVVDDLPSFEYSPFASFPVVCHKQQTRKNHQGLEDITYIRKSHKFKTWNTVADNNSTG